MKLAVYSTKQYDKKYLQHVNEAYGFELEFFDFLLSEKTAKTAHGCEGVCIFVNDDGSRPVLEELKKQGVKYIALRCAGFNNVDLDAAKELGLKVVRVPAYSPEAVAEHAIGMMMSLNRRIHRAYQRTRDANFSLEGLTGCPAQEEEQRLAYAQTQLETALDAARAEAAQQRRLYRTLGLSLGGAAALLLL